MVENIPRDKENTSEDERISRLKNTMQQFALSLSGAIENIIYNYNIYEHQNPKDKIIIRKYGFRVFLKHCINTRDYIPEVNDIIEAIYEVLLYKHKHKQNNQHKDNNKNYKLENICKAYLKKLGLNKNEINEIIDSLESDIINQRELSNKKIQKLESKIIRIRYNRGRSFK